MFDIFDKSFFFSLRVIDLSIRLAISNLGISYFISLSSISNFPMKDSANATYTLPTLILSDE
jgi:hypothetical protein